MNWFDSKRSNENSNSRSRDVKEEYDPNARARQPFGDRNAQSRSPNTYNAGKQRGTAYDSSQVDIENQYFKPLNTRESQRMSQGRGENSQRRELKTPSPSPSRSPPKDEFDENRPYGEFRGEFETYYNQELIEPGELHGGYDEREDSYPNRGPQGFPQQRGRVPQQFAGGFQNQRPKSRSLGVKKPPKSIAADWTCTGCRNINFARRISCNICNMPKPYFEILKTPISQLGPQGLFKDTDWQCFNCRNVNFQKRGFCNICGEPKPEEYLEREVRGNEPKAKKKKNKKKKKNANAQMQGFPGQQHFGNSKNGNFNFQGGNFGRMQGQFAPTSQKRYPNFDESNRVPFNQRPVSRSRSRSFMK
mmetsp:Transcript_31126/g.35979  ORF Transcript_31126/g.35979 Transcript_31126/m.35979 type:complete len:361 (+) Transcript_31126:78-1160(+)